MKKFYLMLVAIVVAAGSFVSCTKDISGELKPMDDRIAALETAVNGGALIAAVESVADGVKVTLSDGKTITIPNAANKTNVIWTIGTDGSWYKDGVKTNHVAVAEGDVLVPNEDGYFYTNGEEKTSTPWRVGNGVVTVIFNSQNSLLMIADLVEGEVVSVGTTALSGLLLLPEVVNAAGVPVYRQVIGTAMHNNEPVLVAPELPIVAKLNPSNVNVDNYDWAINLFAAEVMPFANTELKDVFTVVDVVSVEDEVIIVAKFDAEFDSEEVSVDFMETLMNDGLLMMNVSATDFNGAVVNSDYANVVILPVNFNEAALLQDYDELFVVNEESLETESDSLFLVSTYVSDDVVDVNMYVDYTAELFPVLIQEEMSEYDMGYDNAAPIPYFDKLAFFVSEGIYEFDPLTTGNANVEDLDADDFLAMEFPISFEYTLVDEAGDTLLPANVFVDEAALAEGVLAIKDQNPAAVGEMVQIGIKALLSDSILVGYDHVNVTILDTKPIEVVVEEAIDLGDIEYLSVDSLGILPAEELLAVVAEVAEANGLDFETISNVELALGDYGTGVPVTFEYAKLDANYKFSLNKTVPFGEGEAEITFTNANNDEITVPVVWNILTTISVFDLYEETVTLSPHKSQVDVTAGTFYDVTAYDPLENLVDPNITTTHNNLAALTFSLADTDLLSEDNVNIYQTSDLEAEMYETTVALSVTCKSYFFDEESDTWKKYPVYEVAEFNLVVLNDVVVTAANNIAVTTIGNFATDSIKLIDFIQVDNAHENIFKGASLNNGTQLINDKFASADILGAITFDIDETSLPETVVVNNYLVWDEQGNVSWNETAALQGSYTQMSDVTVNFTVKVVLGSNPDAEVITVGEGSFVMKKKF